MSDIEQPFAPADPKALSRPLSKVLRHEPDFVGVKLDESGWAHIDELFEGSVIRLLARVQRVVKSSGFEGEGTRLGDWAAQVGLIELVAAAVSWLVGGSLLTVRWVPPYQLADIFVDTAGLAKLVATRTSSRGVRATIITTPHEMNALKLNSYGRVQRRHARFHIQLLQYPPAS